MSKFKEGDLVELRFPFDYAEEELRRELLSKYNIENLFGVVKKVIPPRGPLTTCTYAVHWLNFYGPDEPIEFDLELASRDKDG